MEDYGNDPVLQKYKFLSQQTESDKKRLAALNEKMEKEKASKQLIKSALSGQVMNKKIVFSNPIPKKEKKNEPETSLQCKKLFDENDDDDGLYGNESFKLDVTSKRFKSSKESKIIELQSRFAHDPRFKIDDKFIDDENDNQKTGDDSKTETEKELDMLEEVLGKPLKRKFKHSEEKQVNSSIIIPRYDPTKPESQKFRIRKVDKLEPYQLPDKSDEEVEKPEISKERFYEISETFKKDFNDGQTVGQSFSLSAMFGRPVAEVPEIDVEMTSVKDKRSKSYDNVDNDDVSKRSKKKSESNARSRQESDEDAEDPDVEAKSKKKSKSKKNEETITKEEKYSSGTPSDSRKSVDLQLKKSSKSKVSNPLLKYERFFFTKNDERLTKNTFYDVERIKSHISTWKEKKLVMTTALTKKRRHFKHVGKLKTVLESGNAGEKDLKLKYRIYKETTNKH